MYILSKYRESLLAKASFLLVYPDYIPINPHPKPPLFLVKSLFFMAFLRHISQLPPVFFQATAVFPGAALSSQL
jgi:hypothetical protein